MRYLAYVDDPAAGGSNLLTLGGAAPVWPAPTDFVPVSAAQADPGLTTQDRNNEVRGMPASPAPLSFASAPSETFTVRAYPFITRKLFRNAFGGAIASAGVPPAAVASTLAPMADDSTLMKALITYLVREGQVDRISGAVVNEIACNFPMDEEGSIDVTLDGLYHDVDPSASVVPALPAAATFTPNYAGDLGTTFRLMRATAVLGPGVGTAIDCLAGFGFTYNNGMIADMRSRFCANENIESTTIDGVRHDLWYPRRHKRGRRVVTGRLDFGDVRPDIDLRRRIAHAEKLVVDIAAGPIATAVPPAMEMMRLTFYKQTPTGGGADPLQAEGDQVSSYEFTAYLDEVTGKDVETTFTGVAALV